MQILASALPGFRDLRAPLTAGYLWLFLLWMVIKPDISKRPTNSVIGSVYDLAKDAGPIWLGLGVGVAAYLVGSVSQAMSPMLSEGVSAVLQWLYKQTENRPLPRKTLERMIAEYERDLVQQYEQEAARKLRENGSRENSGAVINASAEIANRGSAARRGLESELELPATLLLIERGRETDPQLFSEADRLKAEREFRLAVVPPLSAIAIYLACNQSPWLWLALLAVLVLLWQGISRDIEYRSLMVAGVQRGHVRSQSIDTLRGWVESIPPRSHPALTAAEGIDPADPEGRTRRAPQEVPASAVPRRRRWWRW